MSEIPDDILASAENALDNLLCNCREAGDVRQDSIRDIAHAILAERERCASQLEEKALLMRGSPTGDMMARIFEAEAVAMRNAHTLVRSAPPSIPPEGREQNT